MLYFKLKKIGKQKIELNLCGSTRFHLAEQVRSELNTTWKINLEVFMKLKIINSQPNV